MATQKTVKEVQVLCRYAFKTNGKLNGIVSYLVRASNGVDTYCTTIVHGHASGCTCPAKGNCYHKKQLEQKEQQRQEVASQFKAQTVPTWTMQLINAGKLVAPAKPVAAKLVNPFKRPRKYVSQMVEAHENKAAILAEMREIRERREYAPLNGNRPFSLMR
jgi:hypothetical protein